MAGPLVPPGAVGLKFWRPPFVAGTFNGWNAADKTVFAALSNRDKTATVVIGGTCVVRSTTGRIGGAAGKYYIEFISSTASGTLNIGLKSKASVIATTSSECLRISAQTGNILLNDTNIGGIGSAWVAGDVVCIAWDSEAERFWARKNNGLWNNDAAADPATGTNGLDVSAAPNTEHCLWFLSSNTSNTSTLRTELADFTYTVPSGFTSWMGEELATAETVETVGTADGVGDASAVGESNNVVAGDGSAVGIGEAAATGNSTGAFVGSAIGTGAASATGVAIGAGAGTATGTGTASAEGTVAGVTSSAQGTATGVGAASATSVAFGAGTGSATGTGTASAASASIGASIGDADGIGTASAIGALIGGSVGTAAGVGAATGTGRATAASVGTAEGDGTALALSDPGATTGTAEGTGTATATGAVIATGAATASGIGTAAAVSGEEAGVIAEGVGTAFGVGEAIGRALEEQLPIAGGGGGAIGFRLRPRPAVIEGVGYAVLPEIVGFAIGEVGYRPKLIAGRARGVVALTGHASGDIGVKGAAYSIARLPLMASAAMDAGSAGQAQVSLSICKGAAMGDHDPDEHLIIALMMAA